MKSKALKKNIFYICNDLERALGLEEIIPNYHIICIDYNAVVDHLTDLGVKIFCLEKELGKFNEIFRNSNRLLTHQLVKKYISDIEKGDYNDVKNYGWVFKIAPNIEMTAKKMDLTMINSSSLLNRKFELKLSQYNMLKNSGARFPKTVIAKLKDYSYEDLLLFFAVNSSYSDAAKQQNESLKFVIQYDRGHTGSSTVFISSKDDFENEKKKFPNRSARFVKYIKGNTWTLNACLTRNGVVYGGLSYQITGIEKCTSTKGGTVGNDWSLSNDLADKTLEQIRNVVENCSKTMQKEGFKGLFGFDFVVDEEGELYLIEINARQPASTSMHTKLMQIDGFIPLKLLHLAEFVSDSDTEYVDLINFVTHKNIKNMEELKGEIELQNKKALSFINASQIVMRNVQDKPFIMGRDIPPGVYKTCLSGENGNGGNIEYLRKGCGVSDIEDKGNEIFILATSKGHEISSGNEILRIQALEGMIEKNGLLKEKYAKIINNLYNLIY